MADPKASGRVSALPNSIYVVETRAGSVLVNSPPETLKYLLSYGHRPPRTIVLAPDIPAGQELGSSGFVRRGINYASVEFLLYSNFFVNAERTHIITVTASQAERIERILAETLVGPPTPDDYGDFPWLIAECTAASYFPPFDRAPVPADLALLSLELDAYRLSEAGVVREASWRRFPDGGVVNRTPFIILVRPGNPREIDDFAALTRPGIGIVHPDPLTSGGANWAIMAEYGAGMRGDPERPGAGRDLLLGIWKNVVAQASSARSARTQFENGFGDALITYEQEVLRDRERGRLQGEIVYPKRTIFSEHTLVVIDRNIDPVEQELIDAFVQFLWSEPAQRLFVSYGFRSVDEKLNAENSFFGWIQDPFTISDFGGWPRAKKEIIDGVWKNQILQELNR